MTQKYIPTKWVANETIGTANVMNNIEQGIVGAYGEIEKIELKDNGSGIVVTRHRDTSVGTTYYVTKIPYIGKDGERNIIKKAFHSETNPASNSGFPVNLAISQNAIIATNASAYFYSEAQGYKLMGLQIKDGVALDSNQTYINKNYYTLGVTNTGLLKIYSNSLKTSDLLADGVVNSFSFTCPLIIDGVIREDLMNVNSNGSEYHPRQVIGQNYETKDIYILTSEGRLEEELGFTLLEIANIMKNTYKCDVAYNLDGGGSAQTIWNGTLVNNPTDANLGVIERATPDILYVSREKSNKEIEGVRNNVLSYKKALNLYNNVKKFGSDKIVSKKGAYEIETKHSDGRNIINLTSSLLNEINTGIQVVINGITKLKLGLHPDQLRYTNYETSKVILSVMDTGDLTTQKGTVGMVNKTSKYIQDLNEIEECGFYWSNESNINAPTTNACSILAIGAKASNYMTLTATEWKTGARWHRYYDANGWSDWLKI